ncbi:MAG: type II toxin-antitoxin system prevent-host-death family antitoxin [Candidatus Rokuibacteriota bacterium]|nr:MAG: type II toxin-antitoxin system prevent-host-death family antitoxin [Candidatus Rokubacteria bacterium]
MITVNVHEAKTHLSRLLAKVARGDEVVIAPVQKARRMDDLLGIDRGRLWIAEDFDGPLPEEIVAAFEGRSENPP